MSSDLLESKEKFQADCPARWQVEDAVEAKKLTFMTEERAREISGSLGSFADVSSDSFNGLGLMEQQAVFHGLIPFIISVRARKEKW